SPSGCSPRMSVGVGSVEYDRTRVSTVCVGFSAVMVTAFQLLVLSVRRAGCRGPSVPSTAPGPAWFFQMAEGGDHVVTASVLRVARRPSSGRVRSRRGLHPEPT